MMNLFDDLFGDVLQELDDVMENSWVDKEDKEEEKEDEED